MRMVDIHCDILLDEDTAKWVEELQQSGSLSSEIAFYLTQKRTGGYLVLPGELDSVVDDIVSNDIEDEERLDREVIEDAMKSALTELLTSGTISFGQTSSSSQTTQRTPVKEEKPIESNVVSFASEVEEDSEPLSDEDIDDLADFFGF